MSSTQHGQGVPCIVGELLGEFHSVCTVITLYLALVLNVYVN